MDLLELTIKKYHQAIRDRNMTSVELVEYYLDRINRFDGALKSIICINPWAVEHARSLDRSFIEKDDWRGLLHGVPVLLKDNIETEELPTTAGSLSLQNFRSGRDAAIVRKLRDAGAIILAKTNLHEFALWGETISSVKGQTLNPYDLTRTPGGSSGGTGAALAANMGLAGIGTDTINSIRSPASANNLVGLRPSMGRVSRAGIIPYSLTQDTAGPMARTVEDAALILSVIQGYDSNDPGTQIYIETNNAPLTDNGIKGKRLGVMRSFFGQSPENTEVNEVMRSALLQFNETGACLVEIPDFVDSNELVRNISVHQYDLRAHLNQYLAAQIAPVHSLQEIIDSGLFHPGSKTDLLLANSLKVDSTEYKERQLRQIETRQWLKDLFTKYALDGIIYPHQQQLVCKVGGSQQQRNGVLASVTGFPAACIPAGFSLPTEDAPMGVPIGLEILGLPFEEHKILEITYSFEQSTHLRRPPQEKHWL